MRKMLAVTLFIFALILCVFMGLRGPSVRAQVQPGTYAPLGTWVSWNPTQLNANAVTLPASGSTGLTNAVDVRGVKDATLLWTCTQSSTLVVSTYDENGAADPVFKSYTVDATGATAGQLFIGSERAPLVDAAGTIAADVVFPQRALAFNWANGGSTAGTCTARLFLQY